MDAPCFTHLAAVPPVACTRMYTAQATIWLTNTIATETDCTYLTCFPGATWGQHHHLDREAAMHFASHSMASATAVKSFGADYRPKGSMPSIYSWLYSTASQATINPVGELTLACMLL